MNSPNDINWCKIFTYLSADDRKNTRQTCRKFNELCDEFRVQLTEEMVFHGDLNTNSALNLLSSSRRRIQNIRLNRVRVTNTFLPFFEKHGGNLHTLILQKCEFSAGSFGGILERCTALRSIVLSLQPHESSYPQFLSVFNGVQVLSDNAVTLHQVVDVKLKLQGNIPEWTNKKFRQFFGLFPNVRRVDLDLQLDQLKLSDDLNTNSADIASDIHFTLSCVYNQILALKNQLEKLRLHFHFDDGSKLSLQTMEKFTLMEMKNLKELSLNWLDCSDFSTKNPFVVFQNLTHFDCNFRHNHSISPSTAIIILLNTITGLRSLVFSVSNFCLSKQCFEALVRSQLSKLEIIVEQSNVITADFEKSSLDVSLQPNHLLKHLRICNECYDFNPLILLFASYFRSLQRIVFVEVLEDHLLNIFQQQNNLRTLELSNIRHHAGFSTHFINYNVYQQYLQSNLSKNRVLPYLTHLHITDDETDLINFLLGEFSFPQLKSLTIHTDCENEQFWQILSQIQQLKYLELHFESPISFEQLLILVQSLPKLSYISLWDNFTEFSRLECLQLFNSRLSLRMVIHNSIKYFYDATKNIVESIPYPNNEFHSWACEGVPHHYAYNNKCWIGKSLQDID